MTLAGADRRASPFRSKDHRKPEASRASEAGHRLPKVVGKTSGAGAYDRALMRYTGKLFYPPDAKLELDLSNLSPIQGQTAYKLYGQFKREMDNDEFDAKVDAGEGVEPVLIR